LLKVDRRLAIRELAAKLNVGVARCHEIVKEHPQMSSCLGKMCATFTE